MTQRQIQLVLAGVTLAALIGVIVLLSLGKSVPAELYTFLGLGFGGHLALASPPTSSTPAAAVTLGLDELRNLVDLLPRSATTAASTAGAVGGAGSPAGASTAQTGQLPGASVASSLPVQAATSGVVTA